MNALEQLNEQIYETEKNILNRRLTENQMKFALEVSKLEYKNTLDPKIKEYSNDEKREQEALKLPIIKAQAEALKEHIKETDFAEIQVRFLLRKFQIMLKSELI